MLRGACLTLLRHANATLTLVPLLRNKQFRAQLTAELDAGLSLTTSPKPVVGAAGDIRRSSSMRAEQTAAPSAIGRLARSFARRRSLRSKESL